MSTVYAPQRHRMGMLLLVSILLSMISAPAVLAQDGEESVEARILMKPPCERTEIPEPLGPYPDIEELLRYEKEYCSEFRLRDPQTRETEPLALGSTLEYQVVIANPHRHRIRAVRSWISYDPLHFSNVELEMADSFPVLLPGEDTVDQEAGEIRMGAEAEEGSSPDQAIIVVATVRMTIANTEGGSTPLVFQDLQESLEGHTYVAVEVDGQRRNIVPAGSLETLMVLFEIPEEEETPPPPPAPPPPDSHGAAVSSEGRSAFVLLQVQNLRVATDQNGGTVYLAWDHLNSSELAGYNVYYGTERGRYIQRRSLAKEENTYTIRGLPEGARYYFAVRGFNGRNEETAFSREVSIIVGDPSSATSPLAIGGSGGGPQGQHPLSGGTDTVPGESGLSTTIMMLLVFAAGIGMVVACRRQYIATVSVPS